MAVSSRKTFQAPLAYEALHKIVRGESIFLDNNVDLDEDVDLDWIKQLQAVPWNAQTSQLSAVNRTSVLAASSALRVCSIVASR